MTDWESVKEFYKKHFGIEGWLVELCANLEILQLCASGASNQTIADLCQADLDDVVEVLMNTFNFPGWKDDLPVNPYKVFQDADKEGHLAEGIYLSRMLEVISYAKDRGDIIYKAYWICKTMKEIEERISDEWI